MKCTKVSYLWRILIVALILASIILPLIFVRSVNAVSYSIIAGYDATDPYGVGAGQDWTKLTHVVSGYGCTVTSDSDPTLVYWLDAAEKTKVQSAGGKYLLDLTGTTDLTAIMADGTYRAQLVTNVTNLISLGGFDGVQVDWEDYVGGVDNADYRAFLIALRSAIPTKYIMPCVPADTAYGWITTADLPYMDSLMLMCYGGFGVNRYGTSLTVFQNKMQAWLTAGYTASKLIAGIPFYSDDANDNFGSYYDVITKFSPATNVNDIVTATADGWAGDNIAVTDGILYFNGVDLMKSKCDWVKANNFGGVYFWVVNWDTASGSYSLLDAAYNELKPAATPTPTPTPPTPTPPFTNTTEFSDAVVGINGVIILMFAVMGIFAIILLLNSGQNIIVALIAAAVIIYLVVAFLPGINEVINAVFGLSS